MSSWGACHICKEGATIKLVMLKQKLKLKNRLLPNKLSALVLVLVMMFSITGGIVRADQYDQKIQALENKNASNESELSGLQIKASNYQDAINKLQERINRMEAAIVQTETKQSKVKAQIADAQKQLDHQKSVLGSAIKTMYIEGQTSTLEVLLSSDNLSDFVNQEQYHLTVENNIKSLVDKITALKIKLKAQNDQLASLLKDQKGQQDQVASERHQQSLLLGYNQAQQSHFNSLIASNNAKISQLESEQLAAHQRLVGSGSATITMQGNCGGGYPSSATGANGGWGCNYGLDGAVDPWGMYNQECVSYTAFKVNQAYGDMPYWGAYPANADNWPGLADRYNIPRGNTPKPGSVAVGTDPSWFGPVGHVMWVERVSGNQVLVSQMNFSGPGTFSEMWISSNLISTYIYFH